MHAHKNPSIIIKITCIHTKNKNNERNSKTPSTPLSQLFLMLSAQYQSVFESEKQKSALAERTKKYREREAIIRKHKLDCVTGC